MYIAFVKFAMQQAQQLCIYTLRVSSGIAVTMSSC